MARGKGLQIQSTLAVFLIFFGLSFLVYFLDSRGVFEGLRFAAQSSTRPLRENLYNTRQSLLLPFQFLKEYKRINEKVVTLENQVAIFSSQVGDLGALKEENKRMKALLGTNLPASWKFQAVKVIGSTGDELYLLTSSYMPKVSTPIILAEKDEPQIGDRGVYIAKAEKTLGGETVAILPTSTLSKIGVIVRAKEGGEKRGTGILIGTGGVSILDQVLSSEDIKEGDLIVTSGEGNLPAELLVGYVGKVYTSESSSFKQSEVNLAINKDSLDFVFFVNNYE